MFYYSVSLLTQERVAIIKGAPEFLLACGFEDKVLSVEGNITNGQFL